MGLMDLLNAVETQKADDLIDAIYEIYLDDDTDDELKARIRERLQYIK